MRMQSSEVAPVRRTNDHVHESHTERASHNDCWFDALDGHGCTAGDDAHCPAQQAAERRRRAQDGRWSALVLGDDGGGPRHFLDDRPVHCGTMLELQALEYASDDYGEYPVPQQCGVVVRYEVTPPQSGTTLDDRAMLYLFQGGHEFSRCYHAGMRFRWLEMPRD